MRRPPLWSLIGLLLLVLVGLAVAFRGALIGLAVESYLAGRGFPDARVEVVQLGLEQATVAAPTLGPGGPSAAQITLVYRPGEILGGRVREVRIDGLRLAIDLSAPGPLESLTALAGGGDGGAPAAGPNVVLDDAKVLLTGTGADDIAIGLDGAVDLSGASADARLDGRVDVGHSRATFNVTASDLLEVPQLIIAGSGESDLGRVPWAADLGPVPQAGRAALAFEGVFPVAWRAGLSLDSVLASPGTLALDLDLESVSVPDCAEDVRVAARLKLETGDGALTLRLTEPATLAAAGIGVDGLWRSGVAATLAAIAPDAPVIEGSMVDGGWRGRLALVLDAAFGEDSARWRVEGEVGDGTFDLAGPLKFGVARLAAGDWTLGDVAYEGPVRIALTAEGVIAEATAPGALSLGEPPPLGAMRLTGPVRVALETLRVDQRADRTEVDATLDPGTVSGVVKRERDSDLKFAATPGPIAFSMRKSAATTGVLRLQAGEVRVPTLGIRVAKIDATVPFATGAPADPIRASAESYHTASPAAFAPLGITLEATEKDATWRATGRARLLGRRAGLPFAGRYDTAGGKGKLSLGPGRLEFRGGGLQPVDLSRALADFRKAEGAVEVEGAFSLDPKAGVRGRGRLVFDGLSMDSPAGRVEGLSGAVAFDRIMPPRTAPRQELKIKKLVAAMPLEDISVRWQLGSEKGHPHVTLDHAEARVAGGTIMLEDTIVRPDAASNSVDLRLDRLSLAKLFEDLDVEALSGTGTLSGTIPVRYGDKGVVIADGLLRAEENGVLRVQLGATKQVLERQGEQVALMVQALENFHYETLELRVARPPGGQLELGVHMEGKNPDVMEGHPFRFNISLSGQLEPVLAALHEGRALTTDLLRGAMESGN